MSKGQRTVILVGIVVVALMLLVPPWEARSYGFGGISGGLYSKGYAPIFKPQSPSDHIDTDRLLIQCLIVTVITGGFVFALHKKN
jgi:hypothetical protein